MQDGLNMPFRTVVERLREGRAVICREDVYERACRVLRADAALAKLVSESVSERNSDPSSPRIDVL